MKNLVMNISTAALAIATILFSAQNVQAENTSSEKLISSVTNYEDGIKVSEFGDNSGFKVEGGGAIFTYNSATKVITCAKPDGTPFQFDSSK